MQEYGFSLILIFLYKYRIMDSSIYRKIRVRENSNSGIFRAVQVNCRLDYKFSKFVTFNNWSFLICIEYYFFRLCSSLEVSLYFCRYFLVEKGKELWEIKIIVQCKLKYDRVELHELTLLNNIPSRHLQ